MKPSISIDERGVILHIVDAEGHGHAVALNQETLTELGAQCAAALERLRSPEQRGGVLYRLGRAVVRELLQPESHGPSATDTARKKDS